MTKPFVLTLSMLLCFSSLNAHASEAKLIKQCLSISKQIDKLDKLRRYGGSAKQMDKWRSKRNRLSDQAYTLKCRRFGIQR